jgi:hypothetical protein
MPCDQHAKTADCVACHSCKRCPSPTCTYLHGTGRSSCGRSKAPASHEAREILRAKAVANAGGPRAQPKRAAVESLQEDSYVDQIASDEGYDSNTGTSKWRSLTRAAAALGIAVPQRLLERKPEFTVEALEGRNLSDSLSLLKDFVESVCRSLTFDDDSCAALRLKLAQRQAEMNERHRSEDLEQRIAKLILTVNNNDYRRVLRSLLGGLPVGTASAIL